MKIAVYSRKSKQTDKGESIENQINLCVDYAVKHFNAANEDFLFYEDEGYSGGTTNRPMFRRMMADAQSKLFDMIICYRLDRISRSISDFSQIIEVLAENRIDFVSIREQFDTQTPMGRAMMYIAGVFAQLERETIAERIRDNMLELSKTGRWLGGSTPTGFKSESYEAADKNGNVKQIHRLVPVINEQRLVSLLFAQFIRLGSLKKLEAYCLNNGILSRNGKRLTRYSISGILKNAAYVMADGAVYDYLINKKCSVYSGREDFTGQNGLITYNKSDCAGHTSKPRDVSEWVWAVGAHEGFIEPSIWLKAQQIIDDNKNKAIRRVRNPYSLLSGILRCGICGSLMRPKQSRVDSNGRHIFIYMCELKEKSGREQCRARNINGALLDLLVESEISAAVKASTACLFTANLINAEGIVITDSPGGTLGQTEYLKKRIAADENAISLLISRLAGTEDSDIADRLLNKITELNQSCRELNIRLAEIKPPMYNRASLVKDLSDFSHVLAHADIQSKRAFIRSAIKHITYDGGYLTLQIDSAMRRVLIKP